MNEGALFLKKGREKSLLRRHPWIFSGAVERVEGCPERGATVTIHASDGRFLARGAYSPDSQLRARVWSFDPAEQIDADFFVRRIARALAYRAFLGYDEPQGACRLLAAEAHPLREPLDLDALEALLSPTLDFRHDWVMRRDLQDASIARLTEEQARAFDAFAEFRRFRVRGCAGSGKTLLALRQAHVWAAAGKRVLLLCFNLLLAERLRELVAPGASIRAVAVNDLFRELLGREDDGTPEFWHTLARDALAPARALAARRAYDAVIVDEGQDFSPDQWAAVQALVPEDANFLIFYDPAQNIFDRDPAALPAFGCPDAVLTTNCRNTRGVFATLRPYAPDGVRAFPDAPAGDATEVYRAANRPALRARLRALLARLIRDEGVPPQDILLIGGRALPNMALADVLADFPGLRYYTYRKFKGLEAPILILVDVRDGDPLWDRAARYTAISRAIHRLFILELPPR